MLTTSIKITGNRLPGFGQRLKVAADGVTRGTAEAVAKRAKELAPRDTGELANSIEAVDDGNGWAVIAGADHAGFVEFGTTHMAAQPYLTPAVEAHRSRFIGGMSGVVEGAV